MQQYDYLTSTLGKICVMEIKWGHSFGVLPSIKTSNPLTFSSLTCAAGEWILSYSSRWEMSVQLNSNKALQSILSSNIVSFSPEVYSKWKQTTVSTNISMEHRWSDDTHCTLNNCVIKCRMETLKRDEMVAGCQPNWNTSQHWFSLKIPVW